MTVNSAHWIKNWPATERPRELLLEKGPDGVSDAGLLAVLIGNGTPGQDAVSLARELILRFQGLRGVFAAHHSDLLQVKGLGPAKTARIIAAAAICKRWMKEEILGCAYTENTADVLDFLSASMRDTKEESFKALLLNKAGVILSVGDLSTGTVDQAAVYPREVIKRALEVGASCVILVHNHPSGNSEPSRFDLETSKKLSNACAAVDITVLDHLIITPHGFLSFRQKGLI